jgi:hypothetical protein
LNYRLLLRDYIYTELKQPIKLDEKLVNTRFSVRYIYIKKVFLSNHKYNINFIIDDIFLVLKKSIKYNTKNDIIVNCLFETALDTDENGNAISFTKHTNTFILSSYKNTNGLYLGIKEDLWDKLLDITEYDSCVYLLEFKIYTYY